MILEITIPNMIGFFTCKDAAMNSLNGVKKIIVKKTAKFICGTRKAMTTYKISAMVMYKCFMRAFPFSQSLYLLA